MRLRRTPEGYETRCGRYAVEYGKPGVPCRWTMTWRAIDRRTGEEVPCMYQSQCREVVARWLAERSE